MTLKTEFLEAYPAVVNPLFKAHNDDLVPITERLRRILDYNLHQAQGKLNRGIAVVHTAKLLGAKSEEEIFRATVLGWCVEILQAFFLVADDIMDHSEMRRGVPCWYKVADIGLAAINDAFLLESTVFELLRIHLKSQPCYVDCLELFLSVTRMTECGQALDLESETLDHSQYTMERYDAIVNHKTAYYSFYLPVALAMYLQGRDKPMELQCAKSILLKIGHYFQVQDDYLDCYGDPEVIGKVGVDIQEKKCSWLFVTALENVPKEDRDLLLDNYGRKEENCVATIKRIYRTLDLQGKYLEYSTKIYKDICKEIEDDKSGMPPQIFKDFLDKIHARSK
jgi:farnesyl diphosphate synthase